MQGWRWAMEDAHTAILDLQKTDEPKKTTQEERLSFFAVFDGHVGDVIARICGEDIYKILVNQAAFEIGNYEQAFKDAFLATDRAILHGIHCFSRGMSAWRLTVTSARSPLCR
jgi:protein phosphatase 2C family protein 2/3